jgi:hypothetical protein
MSDGSSDWSNIGFTRIGSEDWVTFRRWNDNPNTDEFWDGTKWVRSPEQALAHEDLSSGLSDMFRAYLREGMAGGERTSSGRPKSAHRSRESLKSQHGRVWDMSELLAEFEVVGYDAPLVRVRRKSNGKNGSFVFQHYPRFFFLFIEERLLD